ncbi:MAG: membrane protein insertase YidC [Desulfococcaceae bacterium]
MEQARLILAIALSFLVFFVWSMFVESPVPPVTEESAKQAQPADSPALPVPVPPVTSSAPANPALSEEMPAPADRKPRSIRVSSPFYSVEISEKGAVFQSFILKNYRETSSADSLPKQLIAPGTGNVPAMFGDGTAQMGETLFSADSDSDQIDIFDKPVSLTFSWQSPANLVFEKKFSFSPDTYLIGLEVKVKNLSDTPVKGNLSIALLNRVPENTQYSFEGPSALIDNSLEQVKIKDIEDKNTYEGRVGWTAIETRYFLSGIIPAEQTGARMQLIVRPDNILENRYTGPEKTLSPGMEQSFAFDLYFGPKSLKILKSLHNGLDRLVHFGMFDILAKPCLWLMNEIYDFIPNYGVAIILLTLLIKIALWPLGNKSYKSMNEMKRIQPLMADIREKYKDDKRKMNEELMNLYKIYKVNPMGGCLPMVLQIPVFFALYRMLYEAIELRHAPFFGWITDLSAPDRLFSFGFSIPFMDPPYGIPVLTIIMGATMLLQQKMSPPPGDPGQARMMMFMPVIFTVIFINFSSGLVLYWLINNILSIAQQYYILKKNA